MEIIPFSKFHYPEISSIYLQGIATGHATFQQEAPVWDDWNKSHLQHSRVVVVERDEIAGWAALAPVSSRPVYCGVAEVSIYIAENFRGRGVGTMLLQELIRQSEAEGIWTLQAGIFPENKASIHLHKKLGFRIIGYREKVGCMHGIWRDNLMMERRSKRVGV